MSSVASALNSSDLSHRHLDREPGVVDCDIVRSLGLVGINRSLGVLIWQCREACAGDSSHDKRRIAELTEAVARAVRKQEGRDKLRVNTRAVAACLVKELILDRCPRCQGRGFLPLAYGPEVPDDSRGADCPTCFASGRARRDFQGRASAAGWSDYSFALKRFYEAMEGRLAHAELNAMRRHWLRMRR